ncbi:histone deacetylase 4-like isoform X2 [Mercenaria mercenaria]|uniref:histone deacetylase 4-like isoform X2 n=1 Tax=Mercenaria mercenaria TaxID=6596 RepID=UPI00234E881C|nr:histone deacetylase 4-like isoform X2 [Mercenaria mercenaria]
MSAVMSVTSKVKFYQGTGPPSEDIVTSPLSSPTLDRRGVGSNMYNEQLMQPAQHVQQQILTLKQQQQLQQQMLLQQFQQQQQQLAQEHEKQLQDYHKQLVLIQKQQEYLAEQQKLEERQRIEKEIHEKTRLSQIKNKNKEEESAVASTEVKQRLQDFVLSKKQREAAVRNSPPQFRHWPLDQNSPPTTGLSPPYSHTLLGKYDDDFPLRKTASEPNLKVRSALKQKVMERRITQSPILRRRDKGFLFKRKTPLSIDCGSNSDSGPNSPPGGVHPALSNGNLKEDTHIHPYLLYHTMGYVNPDLYTSPSMPNISLGRPPSAGGNGTHSNYSEAELRAMGAARLGLPLSSQGLQGSGMPGYHPSLPAIDGEYASPSDTSARSMMAAQLKAIEEARASGTKPSPLAGPPYPTPTSTQSSSESHQARIHRHRPLGRTQSAPLPIGHPFIQQNLLLQQQQQRAGVAGPGIEHDPEQILKDKFLVKQHIRQTVLQRTSSKTHMENVDEETEAKLAQEMKEAHEADDNDVVVVKETKMDDSRSEISNKLTRRESEHLLAVSKPRHKGHHRPLARTQSSPLVTFSMPPQTQEVGPVKYSFTTAIAYDTIMQKHQCSCGHDSVHPEHAGRIHNIWSRLQEKNLISNCEQLKCRKATLEEIQSCHSEAYTLFYATNHLSRSRLDPKHFENLPMRFCALPCGGVGVDSDTVWNDLHTSIAARMAAGCVTELAFRVGAGELKNGFALVRPPGHHAEPEQAMGFCYFNSVAIAAKQMKEKLKMKKILIVDWDVHHGNGTQQMTFTDKEILYISIHRHDNGNFFPGTGAPEECGTGEATGFNVNVAFSGGLEPPKGDAEYLAAFRTIVMPIARDFNPEIVLVSAGFDAAAGHPAPLGGYLVSPQCFGHMTRELMSLANGKIVLALEGGYEVTAICDSAEMCLKALLGQEIPPIKEEELCKVPCKAALETLENTINIQSKHWPCLQRYLGTIQYSLVEAQKRESEETDTVTALASLSMVAAKRSESLEQESEPMDEES